MYPIAYFRKYIRIFIFNSNGLYESEASVPKTFVATKTMKARTRAARCSCRHKRRGSSPSPRRFRRQSAKRAPTKTARSSTSPCRPMTWRRSALLQSRTVASFRRMGLHPSGTRPPDHDGPGGQTSRSGVFAGGDCGTFRDRKRAKSQCISHGDGCRRSA